VISVDAIEPVLASAYRKPLEGSRQVFLIDPADALAPQGAARYLKSLEEPPAGTVFVLLTTRPERLPETVLSRCRRVRLAPASEERIRDALAADGASAEDAARLARWGCGSLSRSRRMARAGIPVVARALAEAAFDATPHAARTAADALKALQDSGGAADVGEDDDEETAGSGAGGREALRAALQDLLLALSVEARDLAVGRASALLAPVRREKALDLLARLGDLAGAVAANVMPPAAVLEVVSALRAASRRG
jgi:hypothetical protein